MKLHPQYVVDEKGQPCSVLLSIEEYRELLENAQDVIDSALIDEVRDAPRVSWADVKNKRRQRQRA